MHGSKKAPIILLVGIVLFAVLINSVKSELVTKLDKITIIWDITPYKNPQDVPPERLFCSSYSLTQKTISCFFSEPLPPNYKKSRMRIPITGGNKEGTRKAAERVRRLTSRALSGEGTTFTRLTIK